MHYISNSKKETEQIAENLAKSFKDGVIALKGELGAGKTIFAQGFAKGLKIKEKIISPTFVLIRQHIIPKSTNFLFHADLYRLENITDIQHLGLKDLWADSNNIVLIEWAEKIKKELPKNTTWIFLEKIDENKRKITIKTT